MSHEQGAEGCAYSVVDCEKGDRCRPAEDCPLGWVVFRDRWTSGGHHHVEKGKDDG